MMLLPSMIVEFASAGLSFSTSDIVIIIGAIALAIVQIITAAKGKAATVKAGEDVLASIADNKVGIADVAAEARVISGHVNSAATSQIKTIEGLMAENKLLREMIADKIQVAAVLAQSVADGKAVVIPSAVVPSLDPTAEEDTP